jgi:hypothetical protein
LEASGGLRALVGVAATLQVIVIALTFVSGMLWAGWPYVVANVVAILGFVLVLAVGNRTRRRNALIALLAIPVVSLGIVAGLANFNEWWLARVACSDRELEAVAGLESPSGEPLSFDGTSEGCAAKVDSGRSSRKLTAAFSSNLRTAGWTVTSPDGGRMARKEGVTLFVEPLTESVEEEKVVGFTGILISVNDDPEQ